MMRMLNANVHKPMTAEELGRKYPRLVRAMRWGACLTTDEAQTTLRDIRYVKLGALPLGYATNGGGEAVFHFGGPLAVLQHAVRCDIRNAARRAYGSVNHA